MKTFAYERVSVPAVAVSALRDDPQAVLLAGGTELVNWLKEGIVRPARVLDINGLAGLDGIETDAANQGAHVHIVRPPSRHRAAGYPGLPP